MPTTLFGGRFRLAGLEPRDRLGGGASHLDQQSFVVVDVEPVAFDGDGLTGVADADADALSGDHDDAPAADPALHRWRRFGHDGCASGRACVS
jgi:hypothetical protein